jgi:hypothetical protein
MCARIQAEESAAPHAKSDFSVKKILLRGSAFPTVSLEFFIDIILPAALWLWVRLSL